MQAKASFSEAGWDIPVLHPTSCSFHLFRQIQSVLGDGERMALGVTSPGKSLSTRRGEIAEQVPRKLGRKLNQSCPNPNG